LGVLISEDISNSQHHSAILEVRTSNNKGLLIPRLTEPNRDSLAPETGVTIYNTTTNKINYCDGSYWYELIDEIVAPTASDENICEGETANLTATMPGAPYKWYDAQTGGNLLYTGTTFTTTPINNDTTFYVESNYLGCTSPRTPVNVNVITCSAPPPQPSAITSFDGGGTSEAPCVECAKYYRVDDIDCVTFTWSFPADWQILSGQGTRQIYVKPGEMSGTVTVTPSNGCGTGTPRTLSVTPVVSSYTFPTNNPAGNLFIFSNYDGGYLTIDVDVDIPNIKIGVISYQNSSIVITGTYASNVTSVVWAGFGANDNHCPPAIATTTITGAPGVVNIRPTATLSNPCGNNTIICNYTCDNSNCGGCNAPDQIMHYFYNTVFSGSTFNFHRAYYGCWNSPIKLSTEISGTNICNY
jgi:hypothetical protein